MTNISEILKNLKDQLESSLPLMEGRNKGSLILDTDITVIDWGYMVDPKKNEDYVAFIVKEDPDNFYFGGSVATDKFKKIDGMGETTIATLKEQGLPVIFKQKTSKQNNQTYNDMIVRA